MFCKYQLRINFLQKFNFLDLNCRKLFVVVPEDTISWNNVPIIFKSVIEKPSQFQKHWSFTHLFIFYCETAYYCDNEKYCSLNLFFGSQQAVVKIWAKFMTNTYYSMQLLPDFGNTKWILCYQNRSNNIVMFFNLYALFWHKL